MKKNNVISGNTQRANNNAAKTLKAFFAEIGEDQAFEKLTVSELDSLLSFTILMLELLGANLYKVLSIMNFNYF